MRIQVLSDLHFEFHRDGGKALVEACHAPDADVVVLAGDIAVGEGIEPALALFAERYPHVVYVHGNHELYGSDRETAIAHTRAACARLPNVELLDCEAVEIGGRRFLGAPRWFADGEATQRYKAHLNDFRMIRDFESWVYREHGRARAYLEAEARAGDVVVTHHLPAKACIREEYRDHPLTCFFLADVEHVMHAKRPALWIHGHTHGSVDITCGATRVLCNPFGYVGREENASFAPRLVVEV